MNPFLRPLFKPIINKAARAAYKMQGTAEEAASKAFEKARPYAKNYMDAAAGNQGRFKQGVALGGPLAAYGAFPERTTTPERDDAVKQEDPTIKPPTQEDDIFVDENQEKVSEDIEISEEVNATNDQADNAEANTKAVVDSTNAYAGLIENESLTRIEGYKDIIRQIMGDGDGAQQMQSTALLMQLGSALMSGKSLDPGLKGFMDIVGQAGMQVAPTLFQMGVEKGKAEREIGAAALNMYMSELDKMQDRSGPFTVVYENLYKTDKNGQMIYGPNGDPVKTGSRRVQTFYRKSPEIQNFMNMNSELGYDRFTFVDTSASKEGMNVAGYGGGTATFQTDAAQADQLKYSKYLKRTLDTMADYIMPILIDQKDLVAGAIGEFGRYVGPKISLLNQIMSTAVSESGDLKQFETQAFDFAKEITVPEKATYQMDIGGGTTIGVFVDTGNKYGQNEGARYSDDGKTMLDPGTPAEIVVWDDMKLILENPNRSALMTFETTLGLALARDRQPTGRMLADVLRRSFADTRMTGFGGTTSTDPNQVIENYAFIFNQLSRNMAGALEGAGLTSDYDKSQQFGLTYAPDDFKIKGIDKFANSYYMLRQNDKTNFFKHDIVGAELYGAYAQSIKGGLNADHNENKQSSEDIKNSYLEQLE
jgi:hypothetical protein